MSSFPPQPPQPPQPSTATPAPSPAPFTADPSTLAATGLLAAVLFAVAAGVVSFLARPEIGGFRSRLLALTNTVDVGDVALLGVAVALLLLTPDPPGGIPRTILLRATAALAAIITAYGVVRSLVVISEDGSALLHFGAFIATVGVAIASATIGFYAAKESFLKQDGRI